MRETAAAEAAAAAAAEAALVAAEAPPVEETWLQKNEWLVLGLGVAATALIVLPALSKKAA